MDWTAFGAIVAIANLLAFVIVERDRLKFWRTADRQGTREYSPLVGLGRSITRGAIVGAILLALIQLVPTIYYSLLEPSLSFFDPRTFIANVYLGAVIGVIAFPLLFMIRNRLFWFDHDEPKETTTLSWGMSGNTYWLCRDLMNIQSWINDTDRPITKRQIDHFLHQCLHHANQLKMEEKNILNRLSTLYEEARNKSQSDWTSQSRRDAAQSLGSILNDIGAVCEMRQPNFDPGKGVL